MNKKKLIIMLFMLSTIVITNGIYNPIIAYSETKSVESVEEKRDEVLERIKDAESETKRLQDEINNSQKMIEASKVEEENLKGESKRIEEEIEKLNIEKKEKYEMIKTLIKVEYEQKNDGYISLLLEAKSFTNFLTRIEVVNNIVKNNDFLINKLKNIENDLEIKSDKLQNRTEEIKQQRILQEESKNKFETLTNERDVERKQLIQLKNQLDSEIEELQRELAQSSNNEINNSPSYVGGDMAWPVPGYTYVSSYYGYRIDPISGEGKLHKGIDIPAPAGQSVVAINDGVVSMAGYNSSYGNLVVIDHGGGVLTYYAHNTSMNVAVGQAVSKGQQIATVGNTGYATGNNMHFEVQINGSFVDPMGYLK